VRAIKKIIVHVSVSRFGDMELIRAWHLERGFRDIGYHFVITNGIIGSGDKYREADDALIQPGRPLSEPGAHTKGYNHDSIGICLIGNYHFTPLQFLRLDELITRLCKAHSIPRSEVYRHANFDPLKTCPNIPTAAFTYFFKEVKNEL